jgi:hypothetical protein
MQCEANILCVWIGWYSIASTFPSVTLFFNGGVAMNLGPSSYLYSQSLSVSFEACILLKYLVVYGCREQEVSRLSGGIMVFYF